MNYWSNGVYTLPFQSQFAELPIFVVYSGVLTILLVYCFYNNSFEFFAKPLSYHIVRGDNFLSWLKQPHDTGSCPVIYSTEAYLLHKASVMLRLFVKHIWQAGNDARHIQTTKLVLLMSSQQCPDAFAVLARALALSAKAKSCSLFDSSGVLKFFWFREDMKLWECAYAQSYPRACSMIIIYFLLL